MKYKHIFFDLDRTLWDFETNSQDTLTEIFNEYELGRIEDCKLNDFIQRYERHNAELWDAYRKGTLEKDVLRTERFRRTLADYGVDAPELARQIGFFYVQRSPEKTALFPYTIEMLKTLNELYTLHIITNGFEEVQHVKLAKSEMRKYFDHVITSEKAGVKKPEPAIFEYAMVVTGAKTDESLMVGDDLPVDLLGAKGVGIDQAYFNPKEIAHAEEVTFEYRKHQELVDYLTN